MEPRQVRFNVPKGPQQRLAAANATPSPINPFNELIDMNREGHPQGQYATPAYVNDTEPQTPDEAEWAINGTRVAQVQRDDMYQRELNPDANFEWRGKLGPGTGGGSGDGFTTAANWALAFVTLASVVAGSVFKG